MEKNDLILRAAALDVLVTSPNFHTTLTRIEELPAVDAIPVAWLENRRKNLILSAMVHSTVYGDNSVELCHSVNVVLDMWQKEQEWQDGKV